MDIDQFLIKLHTLFVTVPRPLIHLINVIYENSRRNHLCVGNIRWMGILLVYIIIINRK